MNKKVLNISILIGILFITIFAGCIGNTTSTEKEKVIRVVMIPDEDPTKMLEDMEPLFNKLEKATGYKFKVNLVPDYTAAVEALLNKQADMAYLGPFTYVSAHYRDPNIVPFVMEVSAKTGKPTYHSIIVVNKETYDMGVKDLKTLKEHAKEITFAFVDPKSTSGYLIPYYALLKAGINPEKDFKKIIFAGGHDAVELAIKEGRVNAGADNDRTYPVMIEKGLISNETNIIIWKSDPIPGYPWVYRIDTIPKDVREKIKNTFLSMSKEEALKISGGKVIGYVEASPKDYQIIEDAAKALGKL
ncbi:phosphate/phosphite/phosphonate ABC transporter substrate-binding protein [Methanocaldococcus infernus]|uniref:Phosphonate ABC transporter, periplasmic phosphonate-binding protein n=1 Tax=Methanocaldococcus infernus (strain DSM 11812 / JCM 15783 / ME) TaxID=573063 RepID=D5VQX4_METIM|nr:phosphate/phosphite/phosphonate ABC transporter substrate-binding protein [Methanocaldococcus infernus]ADG12977.1 phosphonate ABC transporter, periplasmic phosphonate-binding protein [Methanocaldococcus infernus ME]